jgi:hypothetical protein
LSSPISRLIVALEKQFEAERLVRLQASIDAHPEEVANDPMVKALRALPMRGAVAPAQHVAPARTKYKSRHQLEASVARAEEARAAKYYRPDRWQEN